jgi:hypothetical protein
MLDTEGQFPVGKCFMRYAKEIPENLARTGTEPYLSYDIPSLSFSTHSWFQTTARKNYEA